MNIGTKVLFARGEQICTGIVTKVLGTKLRVEFQDFVVIEESAVVPFPELEHAPVSIAAAPVISKKKKK